MGETVGKIGKVVLGLGALGAAVGGADAIYKAGTNEGAKRSYSEQKARDSYTINPETGTFALPATEKVKIDGEDVAVTSLNLFTPDRGSQPPKLEKISPFDFDWANPKTDSVGLVGFSGALTAVKVERKTVDTDGHESSSLIGIIISEPNAYFPEITLTKEDILSGGYFPLPTGAEDPTINPEKGIEVKAVRDGKPVVLRLPFYNIDMILHPQSPQDRDKNSYGGVVGGFDPEGNNSEGGWVVVENSKGSK